MKALILLATLKKSGPSNTKVLCEFLEETFKTNGIDSETIRLAQQTIPAGTHTRMTKDDPWSKIFKKILAADILIFATPIWWGSHSSEMQRVIERLDVVHDEILAGKPSKLDGKVGGIVITGDSDGAEQVIGIIANFLNAIGVILPPYATLSVLSPLQAKDAKTSKEELLKSYRKDYQRTAKKMVQQLLKYTKTGS